MQTAECVYVGEGQADIAGIGILVGFIGQAFVSLVLAAWAFLMSRRSDLELHRGGDTIEHRIERKRLEFVSDILMIGNDIQMVLGSSYMITAFASASVIDLYHLRLVFDIVSFVGVSNAAAMVCWNFCKRRLHGPDAPRVRFNKRRPLSYFMTARHRGSYMFASMFIALTILLCIQLSQWAPDARPGRCYYSSLISGPDASHPDTDIAYVAVTATWMVAAMFSAIFMGTRRLRWVLVSAFLQFPVHLYMAIALRCANEPYLEGVDASENSWDFGQTTAVVLLAMAVVELATKGWGYFVFEHELEKRRGGRKNGDAPGAASTQSDERGDEETRPSGELHDEPPRRSVTGVLQKQVSS